MVSTVEGQQDRIRHHRELRNNMGNKEKRAGRCENKHGAKNTPLDGRLSTLEGQEGSVGHHEKRRERGKKKYGATPRVALPNFPP